ncbi:transcriptional regulatory protein YycF [bacterium BMS3Abin07]|nr:transcriptional regulatory protein YycF [bacterium BMS3Abin07]GBE32284.1 transcriptional regulatory protein YycF [bacterium BMS3Bbin05]
MRGRNILVIEDDRKSVRMMTDVLEPEGYAVFAVSRKTVAVELASRIKPSLIFISAILADASGLEITREIRKVEQLRDVPFVMLTEMQEEFNERYESSYGIIGFLKKPVDPDDLLSKIRVLAPLEEITGKGDTEEAVGPLPEDSGKSVSSGEPIGSDGSSDKNMRDFTDAFFVSDEGNNKSGTLEKTFIDEQKGMKEKKDKIKIKVPDKPEVESGREEQETTGQINAMGYEAEEHSAEMVEGEEIHGTGEEAGVPVEEAAVEEDVLPSIDKEPSELDDAIEEKSEIVPDNAHDMPEYAENYGDEEQEIGLDSAGIDGEPEPPKQDEPRIGLLGWLGNKRAVAFGLAGLVVVILLTWAGLIFISGGGNGSKSVSSIQPAAVSNGEKKESVNPDRSIAGSIEGVKKGPPSETITVPAEKTVGGIKTDNIAADVRKQAVPTPGKQQEPVSSVKKRPVVATGKVVYSVQVGFFRDVSNAKKLLKSLKKKGYNVFIKKINVKSRLFYRVLVGKYNTSAKALQMKRRIKRRERMDATLFRL